MYVGNIQRKSRKAEADGELAECELGQGGRGSFEVKHGYSPIYPVESSESSRIRCCHHPLAKRPLSYTSSSPAAGCELKRAPQAILRECRIIREASPSGGELSLPSKRREVAVVHFFGTFAVFRHNVRFSFTSYNRPSDNLKNQKATSCLLSEYCIALITAHTRS